ncbi:MAG TPA: Ig-like domain-containing protein, partial [Pyrinomonadaceae bacterium]|nr:Ig-like domain-containing protein [Pyrinomonadaceae bacterium]
GVAVAEGVAAPVKAAQLGSGNGEAAAEIDTTAVIDLSVTIMSPGPGATIRGPHTGAPFLVTGEAEVEGGGGISKIEVKLSGAQYQEATVVGARGLVTWEFNAFAPAAGQLTIIARAEHGTTGKTATHEITVTVVLDPPPDTTPPGLNINSPVEGQQVSGTPSGTATVGVTGTTADIQGGVRLVEVKLDGGAFEQATAGSADWASWTKNVNVGAAGSHTITARATDHANNVTTKIVNFMVVAAPPPDTTPPNVNITSPAPNANVAGPFNGATVNVAGTASDARGISGVELLVDDQQGVITQAQPRAPGDWSQWSGTVIITQPGLRLLTARCTDAAGNTKTATVPLNVTLVPDVLSRLSRLIIVESYRLSSYLGNYGAGRTIKTFSLLPGEKAKISVKTFTKTESDAKSASSILDSFTEESSDDFEQSMGREQSNKQNYDESFNYKVDATAEASWGWGSAGVSGGVSGGTNSARENFAKNISNATQKHAARASAKRDVQVNTSYEVKEATGEETSVERTIENINVGRTLNFVFRQMNQEFITLLHLFDVRVGFFKVVQVEGETEPQFTYKEATLPELDALLRDVIVPEKRAEVRADIVHQLSNIFDYKDRHHRFVEEEPLRDRNGQPIPLSQYLRVRKDYTSVYVDEATGTQITVPGIILAANKHVLRTEGVIVEALLGQGDALDAYSHGLQDAAVSERQFANENAEVEIEKARLALKIIRDKDTEAAAIFAKLYPAPPNQLVLALPEEAQNGQPAGD